jgi:ATP-binding cassette subfamily B protein
MSTTAKKRQPPKLSEIYRFLKAHYGRKPWMVFAAFACVSVSSAIDIFIPKVYGWLVDAAAAAAGNRHFSDILYPIATLALCSFCYHVFFRTANFINAHTNTRVHAEVAADSVNYVHSFETEWHTNTFAGSIVTAIKRGRSAAHRIYDTVCYDFWPAIVVVTGNIFMMSKTSPAIAGVLVIYAMVFTGSSLYLSLRFVAPKNRIYADEDSRLGGTIADSVSGYAAVKASGAERHEYERIQHAARRFANAARAAWIRANILSFAQNLVVNGGRLCALLLAGKFWAEGTFTSGDVMFVLMGQRYISFYLDGIGNRVRDVIESMNDLEEVVTWKNRQPLITGAANVNTADLARFALKFDNITFRYTGQDRDAVSGFNLEIHPGEKVALVGRTGSGKSTLFKLLHRYYEPQTGSITIDGHNIAETALPDLRRHLSLVSQEPVLFHRSLAENIAYSNPGASLDEIKKAAERAQIAPLIESLPQKYDTLVGERGIKLSGGERQRVAIARALLANSRIILLDEATAALDNETEKLVQAALADLAHGRSVLAIAHRISTVQDYDRIVVMDMGRIVEMGTHQELLELKGQYARLYHRHAEEELLAG